MIAVIIMTPQTLLMPAIKKIIVGATSGNAWTDRTPRRISRAGIDVSIPISAPIHSGRIKYSTPYYSDSSGTRVPIGNSGISTATPCGINMIPKIGDIWQSSTPDIRDSDKLDTSIDVNFTNDLVELPNFTVVLSDNSPTVLSRISVRP